MSNSGPPAFVVVGTNQRTSGGSRYPVQGVRSHPQYDSAIQHHDIALVKLERPIQMTERVKAICLAREDTAPGVVLLLTGWGRTSYPGSPANKLQYIKLATIGQAECSQKLASVNQVFAEQICTLTTKGEGACHVSLYSYKYRSYYKDCVLTTATNFRVIPAAHWLAATACMASCLGAILVRKGILMSSLKCFPTRIGSTVLFGLVLNNVTPLYGDLSMLRV